MACQRLQDRVCDERVVRSGPTRAKAPQPAARHPSRARSAVSPAFFDRDRLRRIFSIALPIMGGMASQNVLNLVDTGMVGSLGDAALAAVGMGSFANFMSTAFITGMAAGVQAMSSRRMGE